MIAVWVAPKVKLRLIRRHDGASGLAAHGVEQALPGRSGNVKTARANLYGDESESGPKTATALATLESNQIQYFTEFA